MTKTYDYVFKIHTKSNNSVFKNWINELLEPIAGSPETVKRVLRDFRHHSSLGLIGSKKWILRREIDFQQFYDICQRGCIKADGHFIGGTIFWIRFSILKKVFNRYDLDREYLLCELGKPFEPSYTHAWERVLGLMVESEGYRVGGRGRLHLPHIPSLHDKVFNKGQLSTIKKITKDDKLLA